MAKKEINIPRDRNIMTVPVEEAMPDNYIFHMQLKLQKKEHFQMLEMG